MPRFRIYYSDRSRYDGPAEFAPGTGVISIVEPDPHCGRIVLAKWDVYCWHPDDQLWYGHTHTGAAMCFVDSPGLRRQIQGKTVSTDLFREINGQAARDPDFEPQSARSALEEPQR